MESPGRPQRQRKTKSALELLGITPSKKIKKEPPDSPSYGKNSPAASGNNASTSKSTPQRKTRTPSVSVKDENDVSKTPRSTKSTPLKNDDSAVKESASNAKAGSITRASKSSPQKRVDSVRRDGDSTAAATKSPAGRTSSRNRSGRGQPQQKEAPGDTHEKNTSKKDEKSTGSNVKDVSTVVEADSQDSKKTSSVQGNNKGAKTRQQIKVIGQQEAIKVTRRTRGATEGEGDGSEQKAETQGEDPVKSQQADGGRSKETRRQSAGRQKTVAELLAGKKSHEGTACTVATDDTQGRQGEPSPTSPGGKPSSDGSVQSPVRKSRRLEKEVESRVTESAAGAKDGKDQAKTLETDNKSKDQSTEGSSDVTSPQPPPSSHAVGKHTSKRKRTSSSRSEICDLTQESADQQKTNHVTAPAEKQETQANSSEDVNKSDERKVETKCENKTEEPSQSPQKCIDSGIENVTLKAEKSPEKSDSVNTDNIPQAVTVIDLPLKPNVQVVMEPAVQVVTKPSDITDITPLKVVSPSGNNCDQSVETVEGDPSTDSSSYIMIIGTESGDEASKPSVSQQSGGEAMEVHNSEMIPVILTNDDDTDQHCFLVACEEVTTEITTEPATTEVTTSSGDGAHLVGQDSHLVELTDTAEEHEVAETLAALTTQPASSATTIMHAPNLSATDKLPLALMQGIGNAKEAIVTWTVDPLDSDEGNTPMQGSRNANKPLKYRVEVQSVASHKSRARRRAKPVKHYAVTDHFQDLVDKLVPQDDITNHVRFTGVGNKKRMNCTYCDKPISDRHMFRRHILEHPQVQFRPWKCPLCTYAANIKAQIARHINIHADVKPFICKECGRGFNFKQKLNLHMKYHLDQRDSKCPHCSMAFHEYKTLKNHLRKIHGVTEMPSRRKPEKDVSQSHFENKKIPDKPRASKPVVSASSSVAAPLTITGPPNTVHTMTGPEITMIESAAKHMEKTGQTSYGMHAVISDTLRVNVENDSGDVMIAHVELEEEVDSTEVVIKDIPGEPIIITPQLVPAGGESENQAPQSAENGSESQTEDEFPGVKPVTVVVKVDQDGQSSIEAADAVKAITVTSDNEGEETVLTNLDSGKIVTTKKTAGTESSPVSSAAVESGPSEGASGDITTPEGDKNEEDEAVITSWSTPVFRRRSSIHAVRKLDKKTFEFQSQVDALQGRPVKPMPNQGKKTLSGGVGRRGRWSKVTDVSQLEEGLRPYCQLVKSDHTRADRFPEHKLFGCQLCTTVLPSKTSFIHHLEKSHPDVKAWKCAFCQYTCRLRSSLIVHTQLHTEERRYKCEICDKTFRFKQKLHIHMKYHRNLREHKCTQCTAAFNDRNDLTKHVRRVHIGDRPYVCQLCGKAYKEKTLLKNHMESHGGVKKYLCQQCNKYYRSKVSLAQHMKSHTCMFHCEICNKSFGSYSGFMAHKVMHDESYGGYQCTTCHKVLHTKGSLARHIAVVHSEVRDFICSHCPKRFKTKKDLQSHQSRFNVHHTEKFTCLHCSMTFHRLASLQAHMEQHGDVDSGTAGLQASKIPDTSDRPFICGTCGQKFNDKDSLLSHVQEHIMLSPQPGTHSESEQAEGQTEQGVDEKRSLTIFMCEECNSVFLSQDNLAGHILAQHMRRNWATSEAPDTTNMVLLDEVSASDLRSELQEVIIDSENSELLVTPSVEGVTMSEVVVGEASNGEEIGCMVEVVTLDGNTTQTVTSDMSMEATTETVVSVSHPSGNKSRMVTLVHPVVNEDQSEDSTAVSNLQREEGKPETEAEQKFAALLYDQGGEEPLISVAGSSDNPLLVANVQPDSFQSILAAAANDTSNQPAAVAVSSAQESVDTLYIVQEDVDGTHTIVLPPVTELNDKWAQLKQGKLE